jgi:hypothetical protein
MNLSMRAVATSLAMAMSVHSGAASAAAGSSPATDLRILATECRMLGGEERVCRGLEQLSRDAAQLCRFGGGPADACRLFDGRVISSSEVAAYEETWVHRALELQRKLEKKTPLLQALLPGTHNSFNSAAYPPTLSGLDHNQVYSLTDQLRMDMRSLELDVHWVPSAYAESGDEGSAVILCHGQVQQVGSVPVHLGCTIERPLRDGLKEIRAWLDDHPGELLLLYLENNLDGNERAHAAAARAIEAEIGSLVLRPATACAPFPAEKSRQEILSVDPARRVVIVGNCGPGAWGSWVHERDLDGLWRESLSGPGDYPACAALHGNGGPDDYDTHFIRFYEDSTWLTAEVNGRSDPITEADTRGLVHCGANLTGFDQLTPDDPRLAALVWSWAENEPAGTAKCASLGADGRFHTTACKERHPYACRTSAGWAVTAKSGRWSRGASACSPSGEFSVPATGYDSELLTAAGGGGTVWLDYAIGPDGWTPGP